MSCDFKTGLPAGFRHSAWSGPRRILNHSPLDPSSTSPFQLLQHHRPPLNSSNMSNSFLFQCHSFGWTFIPPCSINLSRLSFQVPVFRSRSQSKQPPEIFQDHLRSTYFFFFNNIYFYLFIWLGRVLVAACGLYFPEQGSNPGPPALGAWSLSHWTTREVPGKFFQRVFACGHQVPQKWFLGGASGTEPACQCRKHKRPGFDPWVGKAPGQGHGNPL